MLAMLRIPFVVKNTCILHKLGVRIEAYTV